MSRLAELIEELCPDGVEYRPLGDVAELKRGQAVTRKEIMEGQIPVIAGGREPAYYIDRPNRQGETIVIAGSGAYAGFVSFWNEPIFVSDAFSIVVDRGTLQPRFVYHWLNGRQEAIHALKSGGGVPHVYPKDVAKLRCPIPPLEVQREIVRILDQFTTLEAELEAELTIRRRQHSFYRSELLARESLQKRVGVLEYKTLGDLFETRNGYTPSKRDHTAWDRDDVPWFRMEDIRENGGILESALISISNSAVKAGRVFPANSILVATSATIGAHALVTVEHLSNQRFTSLQPKEIACGLFDPYFLYYYCFLLDEYCLNHTNVSSFASVDMRAFRAFEFPILPLDVQCEIASILDQFTRLETELEAEIEARRSQCAYYRDRLLSFPEKKAE